MNSDFEYLIIGAGGMGSATAYHLAREGRSVLLLEQFDVGHVRGSSHGESRIIRLSYDHPTYVQLAQAAYRLWAELESDSNQNLVRYTGGLDLSVPYNSAFEACIASLSALRIRRELLTADEIQRRFPVFRVADKTIGLYQADAGILPASQCVRAMIDRAIHYGAAVIEQSPVRSIQLHDDGADVQTDRVAYHCRKLIICAGAWAGPLLATLGLTLPLTVTQPLNETTVYSADLVVKGQTEADAVVSVNDVVVDVDAEGKFSTIVTLEEGPNPIEVLASDFEGNEGSKVLTVIYVKQ